MLNVITLAEAEAIARSLGERTKLNPTEVPLSCACGRILAEPLRSRENVPAFRRSTMDGYALFAPDSYGASESSPVPLLITGEVLMGQAAEMKGQKGACVRIPTGGMLPEGFNAVIPVEYTEEDGFGNCLLSKSVSPLENVTNVGDDVKEGETLLPAGTLLAPLHIGVLAAAGFAEVPVLRKLKVGVISTGNEIVGVEKDPLPGQVRDVNTHLLSALCEKMQCEVTSYGVIADEKTVFTDTLLRAVNENDAVLLSGGSSAGTMDLTAETIDAAGELYVHGIAVKPGKPTLIGSVGNSAVFGLPGHPAAAYFTTLSVVKAFIEAVYGIDMPEKTVTARLAEHVSSNHGREEFLCVSLKNGDATPVYGKSGVISQLTRSDGYLLIGRNSEGLAAGTAVTVRLFGEGII